MSDEPLYCPQCGREDCCSCPASEFAPINDLVFCETCGNFIGIDGTCAECEEQMKKNREATSSRIVGEEDIFL
jgi:hypothetical protein